MTYSLIERVIDAAHDAANKAAGHDEYCSYEMAGAAVRAAIELIREPTQAMIDAGNDTFHPPDYASAEECYQAMIDSIAKEGFPA